MDDPRVVKGLVAYLLVAMFVGGVLGMIVEESLVSVLIGSTFGFLAGHHYYKIRARRQDPRYWPGHCRSCGYNLTGNVSGTCPECGTKIEKP